MPAIPKLKGPKCKACNDTGKNSDGGVCWACSVNRMNGRSHSLSAEQMRGKPSFGGKIDSNAPLKLRVKELSENSVSLSLVAEETDGERICFSVLGHREDIERFLPSCSLSVEIDATWADRALTPDAPSKQTRKAVQIGKSLVKKKAST